MTLEDVKRDVADHFGLGCPCIVWSDAMCDIIAKYYAKHKQIELLEEMLLDCTYNSASYFIKSKLTELKKEEK